LKQGKITVKFPATVAVVHEQRIINALVDVLNRLLSEGKEAGVCHSDGIAGGDEDGGDDDEHNRDKEFGGELNVVNAFKHLWFSFADRRRKVYSSTI
jgi:hypothetical protein